MAWRESCFIGWFIRRLLLWHRRHILHSGHWIRKLCSEKSMRDRQALGVHQRRSLHRLDSEDCQTRQWKDMERHWTQMHVRKKLRVSLCHKTGCAMGFNWLFFLVVSTAARSRTWSLIHRMWESLRSPAGIKKEVQMLMLNMFGLETAERLTCLVSMPAFSSPTCWSISLRTAVWKWWNAMTFQACQS